jgi:hypothetical protein
MSGNLDFLSTLKLNNRYTFKTQTCEEPRRGTLLRIIEHTSIDAGIVGNYQTLTFICVDNLEKSTQLSFRNDHLVEISDLTDKLRTILQLLPDNPISIINNYI